MKKTVQLIIFFYSIILVVFSQNADTLNVEKKKTPGKLIRSFSVQLVMGFEYSFVYKRNNNFAGGVSVRYGLPTGIIISHPAVMRTYQNNGTRYINDYFVLDSPKTKMYMPLVGVSLFYRNYISENTFINIGAVGSMGYSSVTGGNIGDFTRTAGGFVSFFYGFDKIRFGYEVQINIMDVAWYPSQNKSPMILLIPLIIHFRL